MSFGLTPLSGLLWLSVEVALALAVLELVIRAACRGAALRHLARTATFAALLALPILWLVVPGQLQLPALVAGGASPAFVAVDPNRVSIGFPQALLALWCIGFGCRAASMAAGALVAARWRRRSLCVPTGRARALASRLGIHRAFDLRRACDSIPSSAVTWGVFRPIILVPREARDWPPERLDAVLLHELAHLRRRDAATQLLVLLVCALYWFHPAVLLAARALREDAEMAADDAVVAAGIRPSAYAGDLLAMARGGTACAIVHGVAGRSRLERRIRAILDPAALRRRAGAGEAACIALAAALSVLLMALARPAPPPTVPAPPIRLVSLRPDPTGIRTSPVANRLDSAATTKPRPAPSRRAHAAPAMVALRAATAAAVVEQRGVPVETQPRAPQAVEPMGIALIPITVRTPPPVFRPVGHFEFRLQELRVRPAPIG